MSDKAHFIRALVVRFGHEPQRVSDIIDRGEALWAVLQQRGYGDAKPPVADSLHLAPEAGATPTATPPVPTKAKGEAMLPAYLPFRSNPSLSIAEQCQAARLDVAHWQRLHKAFPDNETVALNTQKAAAKLAELEALAQIDLENTKGGQA